MDSTMGVVVPWLILGHSPPKRVHAIESRLQSGICEEVDVRKALGQRIPCRLEARAAHWSFA